MAGGGSAQSDGLSRRALLAAATASGTAALLTGCARQAPAPATTRPRGITVTDQRGKTLVFDQPVTRIVTLPMPAASMLVCVDTSAEHLVGMHNASWTAMKNGLMGEMFPDALKITHDIAADNFVPNVESILALKPDVVVQWADQGNGIITPLENAGLKVAGLTYGKQQDVDAWLQLFATMLGKPERGMDLTATITSRLTAAQAVGAAERKPGPSILYFFQVTGGLKVAGVNTYNDFYITMIGGSNPASGVTGPPGVGSVGIDIEQVLTWDPDIVLIGNFDAAVPEQIYADKVWQTVSAVKSRRVYKVPIGGYRWDPPGQESPLMWQWLAQLAFPDGAQTQLRQQSTDYLSYLYGSRPSAAQLDKILRLDANSSSAHYQQFHAG